MKIRSLITFLFSWWEYTLTYLGNNLVVVCCFLFDAHMVCLAIFLKEMHMNAEIYV